MLINLLDGCAAAQLCTTLHNFAQPCTTGKDLRLCIAQPAQPLHNHIKN